MKKDGAVGLLTGTGKGLAGLPLKLFAAGSGIVGLPLTGIDVAITNALRGGDATEAIRLSRLLQGEADWAKLTEKEQQDLVGRWRVLADERNQQ